MTTCADCGEEIVEHRGKWAVHKPDHLEPYVYACRYEIIIGEGGAPMLVTADYHHIEGEQQRLFRHVVKEKDE
jgi:hypothetical protein